jgi:ubiquinone biosynthesis UbiH/UbiF/VisC/COQ6 family hydroxylase
MKYEFAIFGFGISAKITSCLLARNGFSVCLISDKDQKQEISNTNLVTFLSRGSLNYLSSMFPNIKLFEEHPEIDSIHCELNSLRGNKPQSIKFNDGKKKNLGKIIKNTDLEKYLDQEIGQLKNINIIHGSYPSMVENKKDGIKLKLHNGEGVDSDLFILSSTKNNITDHINIDFIKKDLEKIAISINVKGDIKNANCAFQKFTSDGPLALLPYSKNEASIVWSLKRDSKLLHKDNEELLQIITKHLSEQVSSIEMTSNEKYKLQFVYAKNLVYKNTVLLGNIAHNIHPIAGQGLNLSIKDIAVFVNQIKKYKSLGYMLNDQMVLEEFETRRKVDNTAYSFGTFLLDDIFSSNNNFVNYTARTGLGLVDKIKNLKQLFIRSATGEDFYKAL